MSERATGRVVVETPVGWCQVTWEQAAVVAVQCVRRRPASAGTATATQALTLRTRKAFEAYFEGGQGWIDLPVRPAGTAHQHRVWAAIARIRAGRTRTYGDLASALNSGPRAVGNACGANPVPLIVPCHRVVGAAGLGGFSLGDKGSALALKTWLLTHEGALSATRRLS